MLTDEDIDRIAATAAHENQARGQAWRASLSAAGVDADQVIRHLFRICHIEAPGSPCDRQTLVAANQAARRAGRAYRTRAADATALQGVRRAAPPS